MQNILADRTHSLSIPAAEPVITLTNVACRFLQDLQDNVRGLSRRLSAEAHRSMEVAAE
jgi:hypothetical protein